eukprot:TRINITY_DN4788_c0_g2_i3.p1 TRINITY_DN4788_c0_g2~~TRINITY_DN4788_c0_g2_i3.p1  ORF type:complete len:182 (-),score=40.32 TRINITY_DN4788_c0_g2_i3:212-757(-)
MRIDFKLLSPDAHNNSIPVVFESQAERILFNVPEGTQRFCTEHKVRIAKIDHIFLSDVKGESCGGLIGMLLSLSETAKKGLTLHGPSNLKDFMASTRNYYRRPNFQLGLSELLNTSVVETKSFIVQAIRIEQHISRKRKREEETQLKEQENEKMKAVIDMEPELSYFVQTKPVPGKFLPGL